MSLIIFITIIIIKKLFAHYRSFWLNLCDSNWVIYYCHHITEMIYFLYLLAISGLILSGLISALDRSPEVSGEHLLCSILFF